jgi:hypothetical protein
MRHLKRLSIVVFLIGWIAPMWLAAWLFADFWQAEGWPRLADRSDSDVGLPWSVLCF